MRYPLKLAESDGCACNHAPQCTSGYLAYLDGSTVLIGLYMIDMIPAYDGSNPSSCFVSSCSNTTPLTGWQNLTPVEILLTALSSLIRVPSETPPPYNARDDPFNDRGGGWGCNTFVPLLRGDGTKIASTGDIFDQPPGGINCIRGKLADHVGDHLLLSSEGAVLVIYPGTESSYPRPPQSLNNSDDGVSYKSNATLNFPDDPSPTLSNFDVSLILITSSFFLRLWNTAPPHIS